MRVEKMFENVKSAFNLYVYCYGELMKVGINITSL